MWERPGSPGGSYRDGLKLFAIDDQSQRQEEPGQGSYGDKVEGVIRALGLQRYVTIMPATDMEEAGGMFEHDSIGLLWNDVQWSPEFLREWWLVRVRAGLVAVAHAGPPTPCAVRQPACVLPDPLRRCVRGA